MTRRAALSTLALVYVVAVVIASAMPAPGSRMEAAAQRLLAQLDPIQLDRAQLPFSADERFAWFYTPVARQGLPLKEMTLAQQDAALDLLRTGLSEAGFDKAETIRQLELVLLEMEGSAIRDPKLYYFTVFGTPAARGTWAWRYEGHHVSQHWTITDGQAVATSPQFFGANPAEVRQGPMRGTRALAAEEDQARALLVSLSSEQRAEAIVSDTAPDDILTTNQRRAMEQASVGIAYGALDSEQRAALRALIEVYAGAQPVDVAQTRMRRLREAGLDELKFAWMGGLWSGERHYYRIQGPTLLIEYDNTQNAANHIHAVWRDFDGDFGLDLLAAHYRAFPHDRAAD